MKCFIGIILFMGVYQLPSRDLYWKKGVLLAILCKNQWKKAVLLTYILASIIMMSQYYLKSIEMPIKRKNAFYLVEIFLNLINSNFQSYFVCGQHVDIDESCIPFKGRHLYKFYNPNNPNKWHFKAYCLNDSETGYLYNFFMYKGIDEIRPEGVSATQYPLYHLTMPSGLQNRNYILIIDIRIFHQLSFLWRKEAYIVSKLSELTEMDYPKNYCSIGQNLSKRCEELRKYSQKNSKMRLKVKLSRQKYI
jgi:Transposase IS4